MDPRLPSSPFGRLRNAGITLTVCSAHAPRRRIRESETSGSTSVWKLGWVWNVDAEIRDLRETELSPSPVTYPSSGIAEP
jgi:hypothetical protein